MKRVNNTVINSTKENSLGLLGFPSLNYPNGRLISFYAANRMITWLKFLNHVKEETTITVLFSSHMIMTGLTVNAIAILAPYLVIWVLKDGKIKRHES